MTSPYVATAAEEGYPLPTAPTADNLPPGDGKFALPHFITFASIINYASRTYRWSFDEALRHSYANAKAIRRDPVVHGALRVLQRGVAQLPWHIECDDDNDESQVKAVSIITNLVEKTPRLQRLLVHLLEAVWYGRYGVQLAYEWHYDGPTRQMRVRDFKPILGDKLVFTFGGEVGVLVHGTYDGEYRITERGKAHFFDPAEREALIVHEYEPEDSDFFDSEFGGAIHGKGIRDRVYWVWWLKQQVQSWMFDYLERVGAGGFTIYYYDAGNDGSLQEVKKAAEEQFRNNTILFPRLRDNPKGGPGVERVEASLQGAAFIKELINDYFDGVIRRYILGDSVESSDANLNIGGDEAEFKAATLSSIIKYIAVDLQETLTQDWIKVLAKYNCPGMEDKLRWKFDIDKPNVKEMMEAANLFYEMGGELDADDMRTKIGIPKPEAGHAILSKVPPMTPTAVGQQPEGVPGVAPMGPPAQGGPPPDQSQQPQPQAPVQ